MFAVVVHALVTYCVLLGALHVVHEFAVLLLNVNDTPTVHAVHMPLVPVALALPCTYAVLM